MEAISKIIDALVKMPNLQLGIIVVAAIVWFAGINFLMKKHRQRLGSEKIEFRENIQLHNVSVKEWGIFSIFLLSLIVIAVNV
ncbi:MAG: hypothetical protein DRQ43_07010 [Gammaproteobacteria bacterium]|nr:MAG: hypothetical protein DRQ43_07010 [Gammaproteobacteria bacterium]